MTITNLVVILALVIGAGTTQSIESNSTTSCGTSRTCKIGNNCWINGVWYNPCPPDVVFPPPETDPNPEILLP